MNYATIKKHDIANGLGVRVSLFVSGCTHHCKGCFNPETWDFNYGNEFTQEVQQEVITALAPDYISGLSLLGGEPFEPSNQAALVPFLKKVKELYPEKDIWCYSGYNFESDIYPVMYGFDAKIPVGIWGEDCVIDFNEIYEYVQFLYEDESGNM